jgi:hypothetical protein
MRAGFGVGPITPKLPVYLAGFGARKEPAQSVHDPLEARAMYLTDGDTTLCLVVCDLLAMSAGYARPVRDAIARELSLPMDAVLTACTHTHNGPSTIAGSGAVGYPPPEGYEEILGPGCVAAAVRARDAAADAELRYVRAPLPDDTAFNRRGGPYPEPAFAVLDVHGPEGRLGLVANFGIHPVLLGPNWMEVSADWVGPFRGELERAASGVAIELTAALGDINPTPPKGRPDSNYDPWASWEDTDAYGRRLAHAVFEALDRAEPVEGGLGIVRSETHDIDVGSTGLAALLQETSMLVEFVEWTIGDVRLVSMPGEAFHELGREIEASRGGKTLLAGLCPAWHGYLPHPWGEGYEEGVSFGQEFVAAVREVLIEAP